jgi:drug/metabolite transporter (DMT)-like permease
MPPTAQYRWPMKPAVNAAALSLMYIVRRQPILPPQLRRWDVLWPTLLSGMIGMGLGMSLLLFALAQGKTGIVATLSSTAPVLILPLLWLVTRQRPAAAAWWGGVITVLGTGVLLLN